MAYALSTVQKFKGNQLAVNFSNTHTLKANGVLGTLIYNKVSTAGAVTITISVVIDDLEYVIAVKTLLAAELTYLFQESLVLPLSSAIKVTTSGIAAGELHKYILIVGR